MRTWPVSDIVIDGLRERVRLLEDHAHLLTQLGDIIVLTIDILAVQLNQPFYAGARHQVLHAVEGLKEGGLAATRWSDKTSHDLVF